MLITVQIPDEIATKLGDDNTLARKLLEALAAEAYRTQQISRHQLGELLGLDYWQTEQFLVMRDAKRYYSLADLEMDRQSLAGLPEK